MKTSDVLLLLFLGFAIWVFGTIYYARTGPAVLETTAARYWTAFALSPVISALVCAAILAWRHVPPSRWSSAMLLLALPGMIGEALVLSHLPTFMPKLHATSGGRYGAFLFATYALVLGMAELVTLHAWQ